MLARSYKRPPLVNYAALAKVMGWLLLIESVFMLLPLVVSLIYGEDDWRSFAIAVAITTASGLLLTRCVHPRSHSLGKREGFLLTALVWVVFSAFGMLPFILCSTPMSLTDAFFEAVSGFTTTGATILPAVEVLSHGMHVWRALMQWVGGMGIILFTLAVLPMLNHSGGMQMFNAEVTGITHDKLRPRISQTAARLWLTYIVLTIANFVLLWIGPMDWFDSLCHAFGTISTGGISTLSSGVEQWNSTYITLVVTLFMLLGGVNFILIFRCSMGKFSAIRVNTVFRVYITTILVITAIVVVSILYNGSYTTWEDLVTRPLFQVVSLITSTGYTIPGFQQWGSIVVPVVLLLMFTGGCAGSTSGGAKIDRLLVLVKYCGNEIFRCLHPNYVRSVLVNNQALNPQLVGKVTAFLTLYCISIFIGGVALTTMGMSFGDALYSSLSCMSNMGLSGGIHGVGATFATVPVFGKWVLATLMLVGRLEIFTILVLFSRAFWRR